MSALIRVSVKMHWNLRKEENHVTCTGQPVRVSVKSTNTVEHSLTVSIGTSDKRSLIHTAVMAAIYTLDNVPKTVNICILFFDALNAEGHNVVILDRIAKLAAPSDA